ncbi:phiSA1p31-related protein, partial [Streptomyces eurythermus]
MTIFDRHRIVDFTEHPVVVLMDTAGRVEVHGTEQVCTIIIGEALRAIADDLIAEHPNRPCTPTAAPSWERPAEPLLAQGSTFD